MLGGLLDRVPRQAVDDAGVTRVLGAQQLEQLGARVVLRRDPVLDVGTVEARDEVPCVLELEPARDLPVGRLGRCRGEGDARDRGPPLVQDRQPEVVRAEVVAPLRHAVRLVDREERDVSAVEQREGLGDPQPLGGEVEQVERAVDEGRLDLSALLPALRGVEEPGLDPEG